MTPPAGPDASKLTALRELVSTVVMPPFRLDDAQVGAEAVLRQLDLQVVEVE